ncbi:peptidase domain-containing ABC transporter [Siphonobacter sp. BAB-5405]|uniref:peptidase domain-containing ABC transporter n=1 Tax=Siphonobacter sp. BAB-5405 TaxID=1864825 RepID=UPI002692C668
MKRSVRIKQHDITDCGAACLASVAAHYKLLLPIARIRQIASTDQKGTNVLGLIEAAQKIGFQAKGVKGSPDSLLKIPKPSIAHVVTASGLHHYVVIYKVTAKSIVIMDPADGRLYYKKHKEFHQEWSGVLILLLPTEEFQSGNERVSTIKRFWTLLQPHRSVLIQALFGALIQTLLGLSTSIFIQKITDHVLSAENKNLLNLLGCLMIILLLFQTFIGVTKSIFALYTGQRIDAQLILGYYKHLLRLPQSFFDTMRVGEIISRVNDAVKIHVFINEVALNLVVQVLTITFAFGLMVTYYWKLALLLLLLIPLYGILYWLSNRLNRKQVRNLMEESARLETQLVESLQSAATIKRFSLENFMNTQTETRFIGLLRIIRLSGLSGLGIGTASGFITSLFTILILWIGSYYVIERELTPGELLSFYALIGYFTGPISTLIQSNRAIQDALIAADRLFEILDLERENQHPTADIQPELMGDIRFHEVAFRYGSRIQVFNDLSLVIPGES